MLDRVLVDEVDETAVPAAQTTENTLCSCGSGLPAIVCCSLTVAGLQPAEPNPRNKERLEALWDARRQADQAAATDLSIAILIEQPTILDALSLLFLIRRDQGNRTAALALIRRAAALAPLEPRYVRYLVEELLEQKAWGQAAAAARRAVRQNPNSALAHSLLGQVFTQLYRHGEGEFHLRRALALSKARTPSVLLALADNLRTQGNFDEARKLYNEVRARQPNAWMALLGQAEMEHLAGNFAAAEELLNQITASGYGLPFRAIRLRAALALDSGRPQEAIDILETATQVDMAARHYLHGQTLDKLGRYDEAFVAFNLANGQHVAIDGKPFNLAQPRTVAQMSRLFTPR